MRRRHLVVLALAVLVLAGCSSGHHAAAQPTTTTAPGPNPDVVPAVITPAYVDAVFKVLNHVYGNATRSLVASKQVTQTVQVDLRSIFNDPLYAQQLAQAQQSLTQAIANVRPEAGDAVTTVQRLVGATNTCIFAETVTSLAAVLVTPTPRPASEFYELALKQPNDDPNHINPTPWAISFNADYLSPTQLGNRCAPSG
jgi:hypothetical protein